MRGEQVNMNRTESRCTGRKRLLGAPIAVLLAVALTALTLVATAPPAHAVDASATRNRPKILLIGDSIMWESQLPAAWWLGQAGADVSYVTGPGTGVLSGAYDWVLEAPALAAEYHPDLVVALWTGNYFPNTPGHSFWNRDGGEFPVDDHGVPLVAGSDEWFDRWTAAVATIADAFVSTGTDTVLFPSPPPGIPTIPTRSGPIFERLQALAASSPQHLGTIDAGRAVALPDGSWTPAFHHCDGSVVDVRADDGMHLGELGAQRYGWAIAHDVGQLLGLAPIPDVPSPDPIVSIAASPDGNGYWVTSCAGEVFHRGSITVAGTLGGASLLEPIVGMAPTHSGDGYWLAARDGGIFAFGDAPFLGSSGAVTLNEPIVGVGATNGNGYWLVARDGGIFAFGDATFNGSTGDTSLNQPVVGMAPTPSGNGYWLVARDGGVFAFGDAAFYGSTGDIALNQPVVGMAATPSGHGYWLVARDGGIFAFGDAAFYGSTGDIALNEPVASIAATPTGNGYWLAARDGGIFAFGGAPFRGAAH